MLPAALPDPSPYFHPALAVLVEGGAVELIMRHMAEGGWDQHDSALKVLEQFLRDPSGQQRMAEQKTVDQLMTAIAKWLLVVRHAC